MDTWPHEQDLTHSNLMPASPFNAELWNLALKLFIVMLSAEISAWIMAHSLLICYDECRLHGKLYMVRMVNCLGNNLFQEHSVGEGGSHFLVQENLIFLNVKWSLHHESKLWRKFFFFQTKASQGENFSSIGVLLSSRSSTIWF